MRSYSFFENNFNQQCYKKIYHIYNEYLLWNVISFSLTLDLIILFLLKYIYFTERKFLSDMYSMLDYVKLLFVNTKVFIFKLFSIIKSISVLN